MNPLHTPLLLCLQHPLTLLCQIMALAPSVAAFISYSAHPTQQQSQRHLAGSGQEQTGGISSPAASSTSLTCLTCMACDSMTTIAAHMAWQQLACLCPGLWLGQEDFRMAASPGLCPYSVPHYIIWLAGCLAVLAWNTVCCLPPCIQQHSYMTCQATANIATCCAFPLPPLHTVSMAMHAGHHHNHAIDHCSPSLPSITIP